MTARDRGVHQSSTLITVYKEKSTSSMYKDGTIVMYSFERDLILSFEFEDLM
jgi:hypothetical protein